MKTWIEILRVTFYFENHFSNNRKKWITHLLGGGFVNL